jgi:MoaA/NifB/PqqE/SkfB family radical SAM enzyme
MRTTAFILTLFIVLFVVRIIAWSLFKGSIDRRMTEWETYPKTLRFYLNWIHANLEMFFRLTKVRARPLQITIDSSNICQLSCPMCPTGSRKHDRPSGKAKEELLINLLKETGEYLFAINLFNWGEPLINSDVIFSWIAAAQKMGIRTRVSSNLSLALSDAQIHKICSSGTHTLIVSLDGASSEAYSRYRINGKFERVVENLKRIVAEKKRRGGKGPWIIWQFLVFAHNEHEISSARTLANEIGVDEIRFSPPQVNESIGVYPSTDPKYHSELSKTHTNLPFESQFPENRDSCMWHYMGAAINWDGSLSPCEILYSKKHDFGTLGEFGQIPFRDAYNSRYYQAARAGSSRFQGGEPPLVCFRCPAAQLRSRSGINGDIRYHCKLRVLSILRSLIAPLKLQRKHQIS